MERTAGPIAVSPPLRAVLRLCRAARLHGERTGDPKLTPSASPRGTRLDLARLVAHEARLGTAFPDDALVVLASDIPFVRGASQLRLEGLDGEEEDDFESPPPSVPEGWVGLARVDHGQPLLLCARAGAAPGDPTNLVRIVGRAGEAFGLWLRRVVSVYYLMHLPSWPLIQAIDAALEDEAPLLSLVGEVPAKPVPVELPPRRVRHATFGAGTVTGRDGSKLTVGFDDGSCRVLLARFLEDA